MTFTEWFAIWVACGGVFWFAVERVDPCLRDMRENQGLGAMVFIIVVIALLWPLSLALWIRDYRRRSND